MANIKISISYPPLENKKGIPFLSQNRQFQWTNTGNVIFPVIPAYGASLLAKNGANVIWDDAIAQNLSYQQWYNRLTKEQPDIIFIESKTPTIQQHWQIIKNIKNASSTKWQPKIILFGDHVTALPEESLNQSPVDYILTGGDYDFMMDSFVSHYLRHTKLEPGFYFRKNNQILNSGKFALKHHHLDTLPFINRDLTQWPLYAYNNTNYKYKPGAYTMSGRDCWWGKCTFCSWTTIYPTGTFRAFSPARMLDEIEYMVKKYGFKEIFDDTGTFPTGNWLNTFCQGLIDRKLDKKIKFGCNMRFGCLNQSQYNLMGQSGFRFILYGLESSNQKTLDLIEKKTKTSDARSTLAMAKKANLNPHLTIMIGYPWEKLIDAQNTLNEAKNLFRDGLADSMQATIVIPYPGTPLFSQCQKNHWLTTTNWSDYDMRTPVMKSPISPKKQLQLVQDLFRGILTPQFIFSKIISIRSIYDIKFLATYGIKYLEKLKDFPINEKEIS